MNDLEMWQKQWYGQPEDSRTAVLDELKDMLAGWSSAVSDDDYDSKQDVETLRIVVGILKSIERIE